MIYGKRDRQYAENIDIGTVFRRHRGDFVKWRYWHEIEEAEAETEIRQLEPAIEACIAMFTR